MEVRVSTDSAGCRRELLFRVEGNRQEEAGLSCEYPRFGADIRRGQDQEAPQGGEDRPASLLGQPGRPPETEEPPEQARCQYLVCLLSELRWRADRPKQSLFRSVVESGNVPP